MWAARRLITCKYSCLTLLKPCFMDPNGFNETINCSEALGPDKMKTLISVNFAFSAIGSVSCVVAILLILLAKVHSSSFVYRLMIYLAFSTLLLEVSIGFQSVPISSVVFGNESGVRMFAGPVSKGWGGFCTGIAYIYQTLWFVQVLTIAWICIYVFVLTVFEIALKELRHHVAGICSILLLPLLISWVPFAYRRYGFSPKSHVCWIIDACTDTEPMTGHLMQLFVSALPAAIILAIGFGLLFTVAIIFCRRVSQRYLRHQHWSALREVLPLLTYAMVNCVVTVLGCCLHVYMMLDMNLKLHPAEIGLISSCLFQSTTILLPLSLFFHPSYLKKAKLKFFDITSQFKIAINTTTSASEGDPLINTIT